MAKKTKSTKKPSTPRKRPTSARPTSPTPATPAKGAAGAKSASAKAKTKPVAKIGGRSRKAGTAAMVEGNAAANPDATNDARPRPVMTLSHDQIAAKAYEIWVAKGRPLGQDDRNWVEAEAALRDVSA